MLSLQQYRRRRGWNRFCPEAREGGKGMERSWRRREVTQTMYTHVSKCKNGK
jgi:hypothetical protein